MKRSIITAALILLTAVSIAACGVKSAPEYSPDAQKSEQKKS